MRYIIFPGQDNGNNYSLALNISSELYKLTRPVPQVGDVSSHIFAVVTHPVTGEVALECNFDEILPISVEANTSAIVELLSGFDTDQQEVIQLANFIDSKKGTTIQFSEVVPSWASVQDEEWMKQNGWFDYLD